MFGANRYILLGITECGFDNQVAQIIDLIDHLPEGVVCRGVASESQTGLAGIEPETNRWHSVIAGQGSNPTSIQNDGCTNTEGLQAHVRTGSIRYFREIRPDMPVEDMLLQAAQRFWQGMHYQRLFTLTTNGIHQKRDDGNVS